MLAAMFSGDMQPGQQDRKGRYFIDRNGDWFALILSYLREEPLQLPPFGIQRQALLAEVRFYQVGRLHTSLHTSQTINKSVWISIITVAGHRLCAENRLGTIHAVLAISFC